MSTGFGTTICDVPTIENRDLHTGSRGKNMPSLKKQTARGVKWLVGASFFQKALSFGTMVILARILNPSIFGLFALAFVAIDGLSLFKSMGFDSALIQRRDNVEKAANTAFFIIPLLGILLFLILNLSATYIGKFLNSLHIIPVIQALGIIFIINCFGMVPKALLQKEMRFAKVVFSETTGAIVYSIIAISLALFGFGIWSLVIGYLVKTLISAFLNWYFAKWKPKFMFDKKIALEMFHFGKFLFLDGLVGFLKRNLDNLLVGKLLGVISLGLYAIAFNIATFGADYFGRKVQRVLFPAYSKLQSDIHDLRSAFLKVFKHINIFALPLGTGIFFFAEEFLRFVYGQKWVGAASILKILAWAGVFTTLTASMRGIFIACGKPKLEFWITSLQVAIFFIFIAPMSKLFGINGVGIVVTLSGFIAFVLALIWTMKLLSINLNQIYLSLKPSLISTLFMTFGIVFFKGLLRQYTKEISPHYFLIPLFLFAVMIYGFSLFKIERSFFNDAKEMILSV